VRLQLAVQFVFLDKARPLEGNEALEYVFNGIGRRHRGLACRCVAARRRAGDAANQNYCRKSSSFSVLRWAAMAALLTFGFSEKDCSNA
jgi:hypothetical protein